MSFSLYHQAVELAIRDAVPGCTVTFGTTAVFIAFGTWSHAISIDDPSTVADQIAEMKDTYKLEMVHQVRQEQASQSGAAFYGTGIKSTWADFVIIDDLGNIKDTTNSFSTLKEMVARYFATGIFKP